MKQRLFSLKLSPSHLEQMTLPNGRILVWDQTVEQWLEWKSINTDDEGISSEFQGTSEEDLL